MKNPDSKQRLFEVMERLDKTFKPKLNEDFDAGTDDPTKEEMVGFLQNEFQSMNSENIDFDIAAAIYWFGYGYHGGQSSNLYSALSTSEYRPAGPMHKSIEDDESEIATLMYNELVSKYGGNTQENPVDAGNTQWHGIEMNEKKALAKCFKSDDLDENISIDVKVGDTIMTGRFKNSPTVVKSIGKDEHGMPTINGKKVVTFKKSIKNESIQEEILPDNPEEYRGKAEKLKQKIDMLFNDEEYGLIETLYRLMIERKNPVPAPNEIQ